MGIFDLAGPLLDPIDGLLAGIPPFLRLLLWSALASALTMKLYQWTSRQERMSALKAEAKAAQRELAAFDGEFDEMMPIIRRSLGASLKMLGLAIGPAMLASIPVVFVLAWAATRFAYLPPDAGDVIVVRVEAPAATPLRWAPADAAAQTTTPPAAPAAGDVETGSDGGALPGTRFSLAWPATGAPVQLLADGELQLSLPVPTSPIVHPRQWWNVLFANPAGYLPAGSPVDAVHLGIAEREYIPFGPGWLRSWLTLMILGIFAFSMLFKVWWKIH